jgi:hypothetical protein
MIGISANEYGEVWSSMKEYEGSKQEERQKGEIQPRG